MQLLALLLRPSMCGGCGNPGCSGMAEKLVSGEADVSLCKPSKADVKEAIKKYLAEHPEA